MRKNRNSFISVIVPAHHNEKSIKHDIKQIADSLERLKRNFEIIVVVDGIKGDRTFQEAKKVHSEKILVIGYQHTHGKGYAVRYGMARAKGDLVAFIDAGGDLNPNGIEMLLLHMQWYDADIIVGSKLHPVSIVKYPLSRRVISFLGRTLTFVLFGLKTRDTQTGLKIFKREVLEKVLPRLLVKQFAFDIEILAVARHLGFGRIYEAPVELTYNFQSSITSKSFLYILLKTFLDVLAIYYRLVVSSYYNDNNQRKWRYDPELNFRVNIG